MGYKTILTVLSRPTQISLLDDAETLATREDAHLDILCLGVQLHASASSGRAHTSQAMK